MKLSFGCLVFFCQACDAIVQGFSQKLILISDFQSVQQIQQRLMHNVQQYSSIYSIEIQFMIFEIDVLWSWNEVYNNSIKLLFRRKYIEESIYGYKIYVAMTFTEQYQ